MAGVMALYIIVMITVAVFADLIALNDPSRIFGGASFAKFGTTPPGGRLMLLGGDDTGRDLFARLIFGARISLLVSISSVLLSTIAATAVGLASAHFGGKLDLILQRVVDGMMAIPALIFALVILAILGVGPDVAGAHLNVILAISIILAPLTTRVVRATALSVQANTYIDAAHALGASHLRIMVRHILPNVSHAVIIMAATFLGGAILLEASLSFLGLGTPPPAPSWGLMISGPGRDSLETHPTLLWVPATAIILAVLSFNLLGDTVRDITDPRLRGT